MDFSFAYVTCGLFCLIVLMLFPYYRSAKKKVEGFPFFKFLPKLVSDIVMGKIPKDAPFTNYILRTIIDISKQYAKEGLFMTYVTRPVLFIYSEEAFKFFLNEKAAIDKSPEYDMLQDGLGGLVTRNGENWKAHRKMINPAFHLGMLKEKVPLFNEHALALVKDMEKLAGKPYVDLLDVLKSNFFYVLSESVFGVKQNEENKEETLKCFSLVEKECAIAVRRLTCPWLYPKLFFNISPTGRFYNTHLKVYNLFLEKLINDMKNMAVSGMKDDAGRFGNHLQKSFAYRMLSQHLNDPSFTLQDLFDEASTIMLTGYDTVTYTTLWCLFLLALHPEVQEKAFNEVQSIINGYVTYEDSCLLLYLEAVIMETLRLYTTIPLFARNLSKDVQYDKYKVHKGTTIVFAAYVSHRNPENFTNPEEFEPERFLDADLSRSRNFFPFSEGSRSCIEILKVDDSLTTCGTLTDAEIVNNVKDASENKNEEAEEYTNAPTVTSKEAEKAVELLSKFLELQDNIGHAGFAALSTLRRIILEAKTIRHQKSLKDYFVC